jgi:PilZ domain
MASHQKLPKFHSSTFAVVPRSAARMFVRLPAWVTVDGNNPKDHVAFVRDISSCGIFLYSDFKPKYGETISFALQYLSGSNRIRLHLRGKVVRLEEPKPGSAIGVAVRFDLPHHNVPRLPLRVA